MSNENKQYLIKPGKYAKLIINSWEDKEGNDVKIFLKLLPPDSIFYDIDEALAYAKDNNLVQ